MFSPTEEKVLKLLGRRKMTIGLLTKKMRVDQDNWLIDNNRIAGAVRRINRKCEHYKLNWFLNGHGLGRQGKTVWRDKQ